MQGADGRPARIIDSLEAAHDLFAPRFRHARDERLHVAHLDGCHRLIGYRIRYAGQNRAVELTVRAIVADALALGSAGLLIAHNHPSGDPTPSINDIEATRVLIQVLRPIGVSLRDHLVFGGGRCVSFRARGLL
jgi:DNA repair protein RadC